MKKDRLFLLIQKPRRDSLTKLCRANFGQDSRALLTEEEVIRRMEVNPQEDFWIFDVSDARKIYKGIV